LDEKILDWARKYGETDRTHGRSVDSKPVVGSFIASLARDECSAEGGSLAVELARQLKLPLWNDAELLAKGFNASRAHPQSQVAFIGLIQYCLEENDGTDKAIKQCKKLQDLLSGAAVNRGGQEDVTLAALTALGETAHTWWGVERCRKTLEKMSRMELSPLVAACVAKQFEKVRR
jgi:hypothetical protein